MDPRRGLGGRGQFGDFSVGLGNAGGLLLSGIIVSSLVSRLRFFGSTPNAARNVLEDLGLVTFIAIVGINAGATLLEQLTDRGTWTAGELAALAADVAILCR